MIKAIISKPANYIYHMLSIAKCGYDNDYGNKSKQFHRDEDLQILHDNKKHITVSGGEHCGELYGLCVSVPASFDDDETLLLYFDAIYDLFTNCNFEYNYEKYEEIYKLVYTEKGVDVNPDTHKEFYNSLLPISKELASISYVLKSNYTIYCAHYWETAKNELTPCCNKLNNIFTTSNYFTAWEEKLNYKYKYSNFYSVLCNSVQNGAQAIDISCNKDIFCITDDCLELSKLISHEFGIYLLKDILYGKNGFSDFSDYKKFESLAEFYNISISGGYKQFNFDYGYVNKYKKLMCENPNITAKELFLAVKDQKENE